MRSTADSHWPEYLIEAAGLGLFMLSAGFVGVLLHHPASPARAWHSGATRWAGRSR